MKSSLDSIRLSLGSIISFALELLVAADIIDTLTKPVHEYNLITLFKVAIVVIIRTVLSYFLDHELDELEKKVHHANNNSNNSKYL